MYKTGYELSDDVIAEQYAHIPEVISMPAYFYRFVADRTVEVCREGRVLDIGCGNGYLLSLLARRRPELRLFGLEMSELVANAGARTSAEGQPISFVRGSALNVPFADGHFDLVIMSEVVEHLKEPAVGLREARRLLKKGGTLLITVPNMSAFSPWWRIAERRSGGLWHKLFLPWEHPLKTLQPIDTAYLFDDIIALVKEAGLRVASIRGREYLPYLTVNLMGRIYSKLLLTRVEPALDRVLPARLAYRLLIECRS